MTKVDKKNMVILMKMVFLLSSMFVVINVYEIVYYYFINKSIQDKMLFIETGFFIIGSLMSAKYVDINTKKRGPKKIGLL